MYNRIGCLIWDDGSQCIYGGTRGDGFLFRFHPASGELISLGKPLNQLHIRCLTVAKDGRIYGIAGNHGCHLFRYDPGKGDLRDLGVLHAVSRRHWHGYEFDAAVTAESGKVYLGENDRISHLFVYSPADSSRVFS